MTVTKPPSNTALIIEYKLSDISTANFIGMTVRSPVNGSEPCLLYALCNFCNRTDGLCPEDRVKYQVRLALRL